METATIEVVYCSWQNKKEKVRGNSISKPIKMFPTIVSITKLIVTFIFSLLKSKLKKIVGA